MKTFKLIGGDDIELEIPQNVADKFLTILHVIEDAQDIDTPIIVPNASEKYLTFCIEFAKLHIQNELNRPINIDEIKASNTPYSDIPLVYRNMIEKMTSVDWLFILQLASYLEYECLLVCIQKRIANHIKDMVPLHLRQYFTQTGTDTRNISVLNAVRKNLEWYYNTYNENNDDDDNNKNDDNDNDNDNSK